MDHTLIVPYRLTDEVRLPSCGPAKLTTVHFSSMHRQPCSFQALKYEPGAVDSAHPLVLAAVIAGREKLITAPEVIRMQLASYLNSPPKESRYDCYSFVHEMLAVPYFFRKGIFFNEWEHHTVTSGIEVPTGKALFQWEDGKTISFRHLSICLGDGLFLSKAGNGNTPLIIADIATMKTLWGGNTLTVLDTYKGGN